MRIKNGKHLIAIAQEQGGDEPGSNDIFVLEDLIARYTTAYASAQRLQGSSNSLCAA